MKLGIVGNGKVVEDLLTDIKPLRDKVKVKALCVRYQSLNKGRDLCDAHRVREVYTDYQAFLSRANINTVYIGIVNSMHFSYAKAALLAGKHVICEKPFTTDYEEAEDLVLLAQKKGLFLWEACKFLYTDIFKTVKENLPRVGRIQEVECSFCKVSRYYEAYRNGTVKPSFDPLLSGGSLYDLNVYNLHFVTALFGRPAAIQYEAAFGYNGIDTAGVVTLRYDEFEAKCRSAKDRDEPCYGIIRGSEGHIRLEGPVNASTYAQLEQQQGMTELMQSNEGGKLTTEIREFARQLKEKDYLSCYDMLKQTLLVMEILVIARKDAGVMFATDL